MRWHRLGTTSAVPLTLVATGALLAACASSPSPQASDRSTTTTSAAATTTVPVAQSSGPLTVGPTVPIPLTADQVTTAEGPNGAVFLSPQDPLSGASTVVWVIDGNGPAAVAETMPGGVAALAADATNLYVASYTTVTSFDRNSGNQDGQWSLPHVNTANTSNEDLVTMSASGGHVLVMITQGNTENIYRFAPGSAAAPRLIAQGTSAAFGPNGSVYYARTDNHLVELSGAGVTTVGPLLADAPNGLGGGVQFVTVVANGLVWVSEPAGQGMDTQFSEYDATTLALQATHDGSTAEQIVGTEAGTLALGAPDGPGDCPQPTAASSNSCVYRITPAGTLIDSVSVGMAIALLGPDPAVVANGPTSTAFELERIT
jgi:hypothetical protein